MISHNSLILQESSASPRTCTCDLKHSSRWLYRLSYWIIKLRNCILNIKMQAPLKIVVLVGKVCPIVFTPCWRKYCNAQLRFSVNIGFIHWVQNISFLHFDHITWNQVTFNSFRVQGFVLNISHGQWLQNRISLWLGTVHTWSSWTTFEAYSTFQFSVIFPRRLFLAISNFLKYNLWNYWLDWLCI